MKKYKVILSNKDMTMEEVVEASDLNEAQKKANALIENTSFEIKSITYIGEVGKVIFVK